MSLTVEQTSQFGLFTRRKVSRYSAVLAIGDRFQKCTLLVTGQQLTVTEAD